MQGVCCFHRKLFSTQIENEQSTGSEEVTEEVNPAGDFRDDTEIEIHAGEQIGLTESHTDLNLSFELSESGKRRPDSYVEYENRLNH